MIEATHGYYLGATSPFQYDEHKLVLVLSPKCIVIEVQQFEPPLVDRPCLRDASPGRVSFSFARSTRPVTTAGSPVDT